MLTMLEEMPCETLPADSFYGWYIPGVVNSMEVTVDGGAEGYYLGTWPTPREAYADLQAWLLDCKLPVLPSIAQIMANDAHVTHVVRIG